MQSGTEQPHFIVEEGAPPGTQEAFENLVRLIEEQPDATRAVFATIGATPAEIVARAHRLDDDDESHVAQTLRTVSDILAGEMDGDVILPAADRLMRPLVENRNRRPREERRVLLIGFFIGAVASAAQAAGRSRPKAA